MTTPKPDPNAPIDTTIPRLLDMTVAVLENLLAVYHADGLPARAQPVHAARITRRGRSLLKAIVELQATYAELERQATGKEPAGP